MLHKLDEYIDSEIKVHESNSVNKKHLLTNPMYHKLTMRIRRLKTKITDSPDNPTLLDLKKLYLNNVKERKRIKSLIPNPEVVKLQYIRYAEDWLVGI